MEKLYEEKRRYKLYKAKKRWVTVALVTTSGLMFYSANWPEGDTCKANESLTVSRAYEDSEWVFVFYNGKPAYAKKADVSIWRIYTI